MEDGFPLFDSNNEADRQEQKLLEYYNSFSENARRRLMSKNITRPTNVYDVLYNKARELNLAKNIPINNDLEESAKIIRDRLVAKIVTEETDLEKISADFRNSLLARAKIQEDRNKLVRTADSYRQTNLAKNTAKDTDLEKDSNFARTNNTSKNKANPSLTGSIDKNSDAFKVNNVSKNVSKDQDLLRDSEDFREGDVHKNVPKKTDIESISEAYRSDNLRRNADAPKSMDDIAAAQREKQIVKNSPKANDIESDSDGFRTGDISKNAPKDQDLLRDAEDIRSNNLGNNVDITSNVELDSLAFRKNNESKNKVKTTNLETDSEVFRADDLSVNKPNSSNLETDSEVFRADDLSVNKPNPSNIEQDSEIFRKDDLSLNTKIASDLEDDSAQFRADDLSVNKPNKSDLEADSETFRADDLSNNKLSVSNLEDDSAQFRADDLSVNKPNKSDLEADSSIFRTDDLSLNKSKFTDLEADSASFRSDDLSLNTPNVTDLESDSASFRSDDLSLNTPNTTDLEDDSVTFRSDDLSLNTPNLTDLEDDSVPFRSDDLAANTPNSTDLEADSATFRDDDLAANTPNLTDLETDSTPFLHNNISSNVLSTSDLETDSVPFRNGDLSANIPNTGDLLTDSASFRDDDLSANVVSSSNIAVDSVPLRALGLTANVPTNSNISADSSAFRDDLLSSNVPYNTDLLSESISYRKNAVSKNEIYGLLGVNVQGAGTSAFLGVSRVFTQGILVRQLLNSKNHPNFTDLLEDSKVFKDNNVRGNRYIYGSNEYSESFDPNSLTVGEHVTAPGSTKDYVTLSVEDMFNSKAIYNDSFGKNLQQIYGQNVLPFSNDIKLDGGFYETSTIASDGGGVFVLRGNSPTTEYESVGAEGYVTANMRLYNLERNSFNIKNLQVGGLDGFGNLQSFGGDEEFQLLISSTVGSLNVRQSVGTQFGTNSTPLSVIIANGGTYFKGGNIDTDLSKPGADGAELGTAESMMAKTAIGNPYDDEEFYRGKRGVRHIVDVIKKSDQPLADNLDPQYSDTYVIGKNTDGSQRKSKQRYTIANPYAPGRAGKLLFSIKNYSSGAQFFFPPYIESMQNTESANWNSVNFLGRPEAMYTYNTSSRDASITFFVLTDYSQNVDIGRDWGSDDMDKINVTFDRHFTDSDVSQNNSKTLEQERLRKLKKQQQDRSKKLDEKVEELTSNSNDVTTGGNEVTGSTQVAEKKSAEKSSADAKSSRDGAVTADALKEISANLKIEAGKTAKAIGDAITVGNTSTNYSESNNTAGNIYNLDMTKIERNGDEIICKPEDTVNRINTMKSGLMFQPAFFSGDKIDFVRKVEFLSKLTRPAANDSDTGFSFTKPPICHIHLGDWWNHDIVVNSVSYDYADAPWTLDGGRVQPMWTKVTLSFNIIGPYGSNSSRPPLSTDNGGMYSY